MHHPIVRDRFHHMGCFVSGSSIELSCDAPMREPYLAYMQGGLSYYQGKYALMKILSEIIL